MKKNIIKSFKDYGVFKSYVAENDKYTYFIVLSKYGTTVIKEKNTKKSSKTK